MRKKPGRPKKPVRYTLVGETFEVHETVFEAVPATRYILSMESEDRRKDCEIWPSPYRRPCGSVTCRTIESMPLVWRIKSVRS